MHLKTKELLDTVYKVGDSDGWTAEEDTYYDWAEFKEFHFCEPSSPKQVYNTGNDSVTLTEPGSYYFITSNQHQCTLGQKLDILVVQDPSYPIPSPPPQSNNDLPIGKIYKISDFKAWKAIEDTEFQVGDNLIGELEFISCDPTSPIAVHKTGHDLVKLTKPGVHYFISSDSGRCESGFKLRVVVGPIPKPKKLSSPIVSLTMWLRSLMPNQH
ncbi:unnamed protein product [Cochlearia groenlandica]